MGGGGGGSGSSEPTVQQKQLETSQALQTANLNLEENAQRKAILNAMQGMRLFRGSALSRAVAGNTGGGGVAGGGPSPTHGRPGRGVVGVTSSSLLDTTGIATATGATPAGGAGASGTGGGAGSYAGRGGKAGAFRGIIP